jgi:hypothetical protein
MDSSPPVVVIDLTRDNDNDNGNDDDNGNDNDNDNDNDNENEECIKRVVDTIFTRICPIDLVSSDDDGASQ